MYRTGHKVLLKKEWETKFKQDAYTGPHTVTEIRIFWIVRAYRDNIIDTYNLRNIIPVTE